MFMKSKKRKERDVLGEVEVPKNAYWGISTQRAVQYFRISGRRFPVCFIRSLAEVKKACIKANLQLGNVDEKKGRAIFTAIEEVLEGKHTEQFPLDVFQTGSGTQFNINMNEVLSNRANEILGCPLGKKFPVHPNDDVNKSQSSNDVIPTTMHLSTLELLDLHLFPAVKSLEKSLRRKIREFEGIVKVGRTHLQDAVPIRLSTEFEVYKRQIAVNRRRLKNARAELCYVPIGGTAVGTGIGADKNFGKTAVSHLREITGFPLKLNPVKAEGIASHSPLVETSGTLRLLSLSVLKMANDIRWMGSGPNAGLGELSLPSNELGSSIMPGKVNPTQAEAVIQVCLQVIGNDVTVSLAEGFGSVLDLNVAKPLMIVNLLDSIELLANGINSFVTYCLNGLKANVGKINSQLERNLMIITNLVPLIGYDKASEIARRASKNGKTIKETILEMGIKIEGNLDELLDPKKMV
jgi:fumarate hydratase class II